jgi:CDP-paratose 2-epimerase
MPSKEVVITGGAGFIGSWCAQYYAKKGFKVTIIDNLSRSQLLGSNRKSVENNWNYLRRWPAIKKIKGDIRNQEDLQRAISKDTSLIIHAAAQTGAANSTQEPYPDFTINALGTLNLLEYIRKNLPRSSFIYCSTNKIYGDYINKIPTIELEDRYQHKKESPLPEKIPLQFNPRTPYGVSKLTGELYAQEYHFIYGIRTAIFRMSCIYGPRQFGFEDQGWIAHFINSLLTEQPINIYGNGKQTRDILYVTDLVKAFDAFFNSNINYECYDIGGGPENTLSLKESLKIIEDITGRKTKINFFPARYSDQNIYISDIKKARKQLNWQPTINPAAGIKLLIDWTRDNINLIS